MNKQEEIWEEIKAYLAEAMDGIEFSEEDKKELDVMAGNLLEFLVSRGVVIRVDRELPKNPFEDDLDGDWESKEEEAYYTGKSNGCEVGKSIMLQAGYVAVEPIIKEENK